MDDYKSQYEEYKKSLLQNHWFIKTLHEKYRGSITAEGDYIDRNGVLWKIGVLGAVCGFCITLTFALAESGLWFWGVVLFITIMGSVIWARHIEAKFKKDSGEINFYAFRYHQHFKDHILEEKRREMYEFEQDLSKIADYMQWCVDRPSNEPSEVMEQFCHALRRVEELGKQYKHISRYDYFAGSLKNDYDFNAEIQKDIDRYI